MRRASSVTTNRVARLRESMLFSDCTNKELASVDRLLCNVRMPAGSVLVREGAVPRQFMIIDDGFAQVTHDGVELGMLGPGSFCGEMALLGRGRRSATVTAVSPLSIEVLNPAEFDALLAASPSISDKVTRAASVRHTRNGF
jgi:voltage-gated potassium channel